MKNIKGLFPAINAVIHEMEEEGKLAVDKEQIEKRLRNSVDVGSADREWLEHAVLDLMMGIALSQMGYRSVVRHERLYVNIKRWSNASVVNKLKENNEKDLQALAKVRVEIEEKGLKSDMYDDQLFIGDDYEDTGEFSRNPSREELVSLLRRLAE